MELMEIIDLWMLPTQHHRGQHATEYCLEKIAPMNEDVARLKKTLKRDARGKPYFPDSSLHISVSHSHDLTLLAIAWNRQIGVDVEMIQSSRNETLRLDSIVRDFFSSKESFAFERAKLISPIEANKVFFHTWTQKEAVSKALGLGLHLDFSAVEVEATPERGANLYCLPMQNTIEPSLNSWRLLSGTIAENYKFCIATTGSVWKLNVREDFLKLQVTLDE